MEKDTLGRRHYVLKAEWPEISSSNLNTVPYDWRKINLCESKEISSCFWCVQALPLFRNHCTGPLGPQGEPASPLGRRPALGFLWKEWCWGWSSSSLDTSCEELTHWKKLWCWEGSGAGGEGDDPGWDGWMVSRTRWTRVWVNSGSWWWTGRPGLLRFMGSQRVGHDWATELN